jgi:hypothetical protein
MEGKCEDWVLVEKREVEEKKNVKNVDVVLKVI